MEFFMFSELITRFSRKSPISVIQIKSSKNHILTKKEKAYNKRLARRRVVIEHINAKIKTFRCMTYPYRGHCRNRHALRMALICGIINYDRRV
jgi:ribosomal protein L35